MDSDPTDLSVTEEEPNRLTEKRYDPPFVTDLGDVRALTLGSSSSGNADANSQYYW